jgi:hypothetical protein
LNKQKYYLAKHTHRPSIHLFYFIIIIIFFFVSFLFHPWRLSKTRSFSISSHVFFLSFFSQPSLPPL